MYLFYINHISEEQQMYEEKRTGYINSIQDMLMKFAAQFKLQQKEKYIFNITIDMISKKKQFSYQKNFAKKWQRLKNEKINFSLLLY